MVPSGGTTSKRPSVSALDRPSGSVVAHPQLDRHRGADPAPDGRGHRLVVDLHGGRGLDVPGAAGEAAVRRPGQGQRGFGAAHREFGGALGFGRPGVGEGARQLSGGGRVADRGTGAVGRVRCGLGGELAPRRGGGGVEVAVVGARGQQQPLVRGDTERDTLFRRETAVVREPGRRLPGRARCHRLHRLVVRRGVERRSAHGHPGGPGHRCRVVRDDGVRQGPAVARLDAVHAVEGEGVVGLAVTVLHVAVDAGEHRARRRCSSRRRPSPPGRRRPAPRRPR